MIRMLTALACFAALLVGCAGHTTTRFVVRKPTLPRVLGTQLATLSETVAAKLDAGDSCGALRTAEQLRSRALAAVATGKVRPALGARLTSATARLQAEIVCVPAPPRQPGHEEHGNGKHKGHDRGEGD
jgi:hypothetical protein